MRRVFILASLYLVQLLALTDAGCTPIHAQSVHSAPSLACYGASISQWRTPILSASRQTGISARTIAAVMTVESDGQSSVVSSAGAIGLLQLEPATAAAFGVNPYVPTQNILGGARVLRYFRDYWHGNRYLMLASYNAGFAYQYGESYAGTVLSRECGAW